MPIRVQLDESCPLAPSDSLSKTSLMPGLGETDDEIDRTLDDIRNSAAAAVRC
jgi:lipoate synthase